MCLSSLSCAEPSDFDAEFFWCFGGRQNTSKTQRQNQLAELKERNRSVVKKKEVEKSANATLHRQTHGTGLSPWGYRTPRR